MVKVADVYLIFLAGNLVFVSWSRALHNLSPWRPPCITKLLRSDIEQAPFPSELLTRHIYTRESRLSNIYIYTYSVCKRKHWKGLIYVVMWRWHLVCVKLKRESWRGWKLSRLTRIARCTARAFAGSLDSPTV